MVFKNTAISNNTDDTAEATTRAAAITAERKLEQRQMFKTQLLNNTDAITAVLARTTADGLQNTAIPTNNGCTQQKL
jgi:hypothetical protein